MSGLWLAAIAAISAAVGGFLAWLRGRDQRLAAERDRQFDALLAEQQAARADRIRKADVATASELLAAVRAVDAAAARAREHASTDLEGAAAELRASTEEPWPPPRPRSLEGEGDDP